MIPIYRAKKKDGSEYVIGYLGQYDNGDYWIKPLPMKICGIAISSTSGKNWVDIDISTLSIHFSDMVDVEGDKIFASLQEFGTGGDIITDGEYDFVVIFNGRNFDLMFVEDNTFTKLNEWEDWNQFMKKESYDK